MPVMNEHRGMIMLNNHSSGHLSVTYANSTPSVVNSADSTDSAAKKTSSMNSACFSANGMLTLPNMEAASEEIPIPSNISKVTKRISGPRIQWKTSEGPNPDVLSNGIKHGINVPVSDPVIALKNRDSSVSASKDQSRAKFKPNGSQGAQGAGHGTIILGLYNDKPAVKKYIPRQEYEAMGYFQKRQEDKLSVGDVVPLIYDIGTEDGRYFVVMENLIKSSSSNAKLIDIKLSHTTQWALNKAEKKGFPTLLRKHIEHNIQQFLRGHRRRGWAVIDRNDERLSGLLRPFAKIIEPLIVGRNSEDYVRKAFNVPNLNPDDLRTEAVSQLTVIKDALAESAVHSVGGSLFLVIDKDQQVVKEAVRIKFSDFGHAFFVGPSSPTNDKPDLPGAENHSAITQNQATRFKSNTLNSISAFMAFLDNSPQ